MPTLRLPFTPFYLGPPSEEERAAVEASTARLPFTFPHPGVTQAAPPLPPETASEGWTLDHHKVQVGHGCAAYDRARCLLQQWRHFDLPWASTNAPAVKPGAGVVVTARTLFAWSCSPLRITYAEECPLRAGQLPPWAPAPPPRPKGATQLHTSCGGAGGGGGCSGGGAAAARGAGGRAHQRQAEQVATMRPPKGRRYAFAHTTLEGHTIKGEERFSVAWNQDDDSVWYEIYTLSRPASWVTTLAHMLLRAYQRKFAQDSMAAMQREMAAAGAGKR
ncbi:hypothetical protein ABPG75_006293 [Micractinium tetrahymenae]